jgi:hypothetical protein
VDAAVEGKASLVTGLAPFNQLGSGVANTSTCQNGNSTWGSCGGGSPAGITYATTAQNWWLTSTTALTAGSPGTVTLTPCPSGVDYTSGAGYQVYISDTNAEAVSVTSGSTGPGNCSITFTPYFGHTSYTIGSASSGIQEAINIACGVYSSIHPTYNSQCNVTIPANGPYLGSGSLWSVNNYNVHGTIFLHANQSVLSGYGVSLNCLGRGPCLQIGDHVSGGHYQNTTVEGLTFRSPTNYSGVSAYAGCAITQTQTTGTLATITTSSACGFRPGDLVTIQFTDAVRYWGDAIVASSSGTTFTFSKHSFTTLSAQPTPGVVALAYEAVLDNANSSHFRDISYDINGNSGAFNNFFDMWDDENATIEHFNNNAIPLNGNINWTGSSIYSGGGPIGPSGNPGQQWAAVITLRDSNITGAGSNGVTVLNSNGLYVENTVIQGTGPWQVKSSNEKGNYQGAYLENVYSESNANVNPLSPPISPFPGLGISGLIAGSSTNAANFEISGGSGSLVGAVPSGGAGSTPYSYFIVVNDTTTGGSNPNCTQCQTSPMQVLNWMSTGSDSIPVRWPRVANGTDAITYDVIRMTTPAGIGAVFPYTGGCLGGSGGTCGYVAFHLSQAAACGNTLICLFTDTHSTTICGTETCAYTINSGNYNGPLNFWPGGLVSVSQPVVTTVEQGAQGGVTGVGLNGNPIQIETQCSGYGAASSGGYTFCAGSRTSPNAVPNQTATIMTDGGRLGGGQTLVKGRLNFSISPFAVLQPHHIITLIDSQPGLSQGTIGYRPPASANDVWIGTDVPVRGVGLNAGQLAFGAPVSITNYIGATGDGVHANWLERLTSKQKTFAIPVMISDGNTLTLGDGSPLSQMKIYRINNMPASHVPPQSCVDVVGEAKGLTKSDQIASVTPPGRLGNLSLNTYSADEGAIIFHFCNPSGSEAITPSGAYSFLAVR